eukprot:CCRYP_014279-RA/>CCRYP_014279-RA protein AED:0.30 eAED:0.30 QI:401/1/1/1/1/1/4/570/1086
MEYDRALFRVYERILEDLNASPSPMAAYASAQTAPSAATSAVSSRRNGRRPSHRAANAAAAAAAENESADDLAIDRSNRHHDEENPLVTTDAATRTDSNDEQASEREEAMLMAAPPSNDSSQTERRSDTRQRNSRNRTRPTRGRPRRTRQRRQTTRTPLDGNDMAVVYSRHYLFSSRNNVPPIPFFLPIWMSLKLEKMKNALFMNRTMLWLTNDDSGNTTSGRWMQPLTRMTDMVLRRNHNDATPSDRFFPSTPTRYRSLLVHSNSPGSFRHIDSDAEDNPSSSDHHHHHHDDDDHPHNTEPDQDGSNTRTIPRLSPEDTSRDGLRRRTASTSSPSPRTRTSPSNSPSHRSSSSSSSSSLSRNSNGVIVSPPLSPPRSPPGAVLQPRPSPVTSSFFVSSSLALGDRDTYTASSSSSPSSTSSSSSSSWEDVENESNPRMEGPTSNGGGGGGGGPTTLSLTQRAIQMQLRHSERIQSFSSRGSSTNHRGEASDRFLDEDGEASTSTSDNDNDDDDESSREQSSDDDDDDSAHSSSEESGDRTHHEGCSQRNLYVAMRLSFVLGILHLFVLLSLHVTYVGPYAFRRQSINVVQRRLNENNEEADVVENTSGDHLVNCLSRALSTRSPQDRSKYHALFGNAGKNDGKRRSLREVSPLDFPIDDGYLPNSTILDRDIYYYDDDPWDSRMLENEQSASPNSVPQLPLLGKDEILQIKILYGGRCVGQCSRVRFVQYLETDSVIDEKQLSNNTTRTRLFQQQHVVNSDNAHNAEGNGNSSGSRLRGHSRLDNKRRLMNDDFPPPTQEDTGDAQHRNLFHKWNRHSEERSNTQIQTEDVDELSSPEFWEDPSYRFSIDDALLYLDEKSIYLHNITIVNVTVTERCLSTGSDDGELTFLTAVGEFLSQIYGMDSIIINQLMFGIRSVDGSHLGGYVQSMETKERWGWRKDQIEAYDGKTSIAQWIARKLGVLFMSLLAFFLITSVTSLIVRVLTSSGVVLMFPLFSFFRRMGVPGADERILALSYPWIGTARRAIRSNHTHPQSHLVWAHMTKIVLYYVMYEACQAAWSIVLYAKSIPEALPVWIYGLGKSSVP